MNLNILKVSATFIEPLLGTASGNPELHAEFISAKARSAEDSAEEVAAIPVDEQITKASTVFPRDEQGPFLWDYQVKGFLKEAIGTLAELGEVTGISKWTYKRTVDSLLFVSPRKVRLTAADGQPCSKTVMLQRPLRAETMQGPRVALANSEQLPAGTRIAFEITRVEGGEKSKLKLSDETLRAALDYGALRGLGQWRNASFGRFSWEEVK